VSSAPGGTTVRARLLGRFAISLSGHEAGPWPRPSAKRLCELVLVTPSRRVTRDVACEMLFPGRNAAEARRALVKALSMAKCVLRDLGGEAARLLDADRTSVWVAPDVALEVDADHHESELRAALAMSPGRVRDDRLAAALADDGTFLADEPYEDWAIGPRQRLDALRQQGRLVLARDRARGTGWYGPRAVTDAWESCLIHDPACEEAAAALVRAYSSQGLRQLALGAYERCRTRLDGLGLRPSPALEEVRAICLSAPPGARLAPISTREERRVVSVLFAEVVAASELLRDDPEDLRDMVGDALTNVITAVEALGGMVISVSGAGLQAVFGAPEAHEDDPERAVRAAFRAISGAAVRNGALRVGLETGPAIYGPAQAGLSARGPGGPPDG
jgi:DNA-binding SARP family transcriptional activator